MAEPKGRPRVLVRRHKIELPEEVLALAESFSKDYKKPILPRILGAAIVAAGVFTLTMITAAMIRKVIAGVIGLGVKHQLNVINFFSGAFKASTAVTRGIIGFVGGGGSGGGADGDDEAAIPPETIETISSTVTEEIEKSLPGITTFAISMGMTAGGMVLAGQNPAEFVKGIADLIDGLIPG